MTTEQMARGGLYSAPQSTWIVYQEYVAKAQEAVADLVRRSDGTLEPLGPLAEYVTRHCTECDQNVYVPDGKHIMYNGFVLVGCEGYWLVNPRLLNLDPKLVPPVNVASWTDWTAIQKDERTIPPTA